MCEEARLSPGFWLGQLQKVLGSNLDGLERPSPYHPTQEYQQSSCSASHTALVDLEILSYYTTDPEVSATASRLTGTEGGWGQEREEDGHLLHLILPKRFMSSILFNFGKNPLRQAGCHPHFIAAELGTK